MALYLLTFPQLDEHALCPILSPIGEQKQQHRKHHEQQQRRLTRDGGRERFACHPVTAFIAALIAIRRGIVFMLVAHDGGKQGSNDLHLRGA